MEKKIINLIQSPAIYQFQQKIGGMEEFYKNIINSEVNLNQIKNVLDIGCGLGSHSEFFDKDSNYIGIDLNIKRVNYAIEKYQSTNRVFECSSINNLKTNLEFDLAILIGVIHHLSNKEIEDFVSDLKSSTLKINKLIILDPVKIPKQKLLSKILQKLDVGANIKLQHEYTKFYDGLNFKSEVLYNEKLSFTPFLKTVIKLNS